MNINVHDAFNTLERMIIQSSVVLEMLPKVTKKGGCQIL
uniref:Uncharacterized protein n=1 Tax=Arcella intermedia TaxID=1963864 RepID=A0A6B2LWM6_9EUKA